MREIPDAIQRREAERKRFARSVEFELIAAKWGDSDMRKWTGWGIDVSCAGLGMWSDFPLTRGMVVRLALPVQETGIALPVFAEVAWTNSTGGRFRAGLRFLR